SHPASEVNREAMLEYRQLWNEGAAPPITTRSRQELIRFFDRLELLEPGVVSCPLWRPDPSHVGTPMAVDEFCGIGRKPPLPAHGCTAAALAATGGHPARSGTRLVPVARYGGVARSSRGAGSLGCSPAPVAPSARGVP
ncbi:MAG: SAM-dependent methyltransferase, partial [Pseudonocardiaceae bacterium]